MADIEVDSQTLSSSQRGGRFTLKGTYDNVQRYFCLSQLGGMLLTSSEPEILLLQRTG